MAGSDLEGFLGVGHHDRQMIQTPEKSFAPGRFANPGNIRRQRAAVNGGVAAAGDHVEPHLQSFSGLFLIARLGWQLGSPIQCRVVPPLTDLVDMRQSTAGG
jgi:hypothetical protein